MKKAEALPLALLTIVACTGAAADHVNLGDRAYVDHNYGEALVEFQLALRQDPADADLMRKAGMAALNSRDLGEATEQFHRLAQKDDDYADFAAEGLERVARAASSAGNRAALQTAIDALREIAPDRASSSFASDLAEGLEGSPPSTDGLSILLFAASSAPDARLQDSLMFAYGVMLVRLGRCEEAVPVFESILLRQREMSVQADARVRAAACSSQLGRRSVNRGDPATAATWFGRAVAVGNNNYAARAASVGLGNLLFAQSDYAGAAAAFRNALIGGTAGDSISTAAQRGLDRLSGLVTPDTTGTVLR